MPDYDSDSSCDYDTRPEADQAALGLRRIVSRTVPVFAIPISVWYHSGLAVHQEDRK